MATKNITKQKHGTRDWRQKRFAAERQSWQAWLKQVCLSDAQTTPADGISSLQGRMHEELKARATLIIDSLAAVPSRIESEIWMRLRCVSDAPCSRVRTCS